MKTQDEIDIEEICSQIDFTPFVQSSYKKHTTEELLEEAKNGSKCAAYELGCRYEREKNLDLAYKYFTMATNLGHPYSKESLKRVEKNIWSKKRRKFLIAISSIIALGCIYLLSHLIQNFL